MRAAQLSIMGAACLRCGVPVISSLANYFGERPLDVVLFDADHERLDLFDRFARFVFAGMHSTHTLRSTEEVPDALMDAELVIVQLDENCARKLLGDPTGASPMARAAQQIAESIRKDASVLNLVAGMPLPGCNVRDLDWPPPVTTEYEKSLPHRILRCLHQEDSPYPFLKEYVHSPVVRWLNDAEAGLA
jgi:hypothetical protein